VPGPTQVLVVGLGTIARTHLEVLRTRPDVTLVGGVDPYVDAVDGLPTFESVAQALAAGVRPDLAVVATPTDTHVELVAELLDTTAARVLSEKPLARTVGDLAGLVARHPGRVLHERLAVAHHFAFSPEVEWARRVVASRPEWGSPTRVTCVFMDPYGVFPPERQAVYVSSWVDSGPNQLSVLAAFDPEWRVGAHLDEGDQSVTVLQRPAGSALLVSGWGAAGSSKQTQVEFLGGRVEVRLDHTSMTGLVREGDALTAHASYAGTVDRKHAHYRGVYEALLSGARDDRLGLALAERIARTLEEAAEAPRADLALSSLV